MLSTTSMRLLHTQKSHRQRRQGFRILPKYARQCRKYLPTLPKCYRQRRQRFQSIRKCRRFCRQGFRSLRNCCRQCRRDFCAHNRVAFGRWQASSTAEIFPATSARFLPWQKYSRHRWHSFFHGRRKKERKRGRKLAVKQLVIYPTVANGMQAQAVAAGGVCNAHQLLRLCGVGRERQSYVPHRSAQV